MEDILTSNVFGLLRYVQPQEGILKYLSLAEDEGGERPLKYLCTLSKVPHESIEYEFWPWWEKAGCIGCEPDVVISLEIPHKEDLLILIEAKYLSGKSSEADESDDKPNDQLAKEWDNLIGKAEASNKKPVLIYLTAGYGYPSNDIKEAVNEFEKERQNREKPEFYWLSWRHLYKVCENSSTIVLDDLISLLNRLNFKFFNGVALEYANIPWSLERPSIVFDWQIFVGIRTIGWRFE